MCGFIWESKASQCFRFSFSLKEVLLLLTLNLLLFPANFRTTVSKLIFLYVFCMTPLLT